ncbi:M23 family metallopeptidase [Paenibacillus albidus]|uniref:M23 family metallopeptidase n=1 Tax=Paenibacillus albidus TaxID=2041023 RepID=UPI001BE7DCD0|nr:M23 family metallopeptidase [Paenibacillus albidus]MBT2292115.1 M23 family metallopeptidase [Paenibacillus albidus]
MKRTRPFGKMIWGTAALAVILSGCGNSAEQNNAEQVKPKTTEAATAAPTASQPVESAGASEASTLQPEDLPQAMLDGKYKEIYTLFSGELKQQIGETEVKTTTAEFVQGVDAFAPSSMMLLNGTEQRTWKSTAGDKGISAVFDQKGGLLGIQILNLQSHPKTDQTMTRTAFAPPFKEDLLVYWGGTNVLDNYHYEHETQRYAYDLVQAVDQFSYSGDPLKNESYHAFGLDITAPADGTVVSVKNDIADNVPVGVMNEKEPAGNLVVIDHGGEYSYLAHLKKGSVTVKPGDSVTTGQVIGLLGNSGNSSEAHLHFQVSDGPDLFTSKSIPIRWKDGKYPVKGDTFTGTSTK